VFHARRSQGSQLGGIGKSPRYRIIEERWLDESVLFLCSDGAKYVTSTDVMVDDSQSTG
jgi:hypothetical protein